MADFTQGVCGDGAAILKDGVALTIEEVLDLLRKGDALMGGGEPVAWEFQHEETGAITFVDRQQVEWGFEKNNPRWQKIGPVYRHPQPSVDDAVLKGIIKQRDAAIRLLAEWCHDIDKNGTGWDDWDENYKNARYRPGPLRELIDAELEAMEAEKCR